MKGLTNAVATSGASGGDIIYAINNTGADITKGQKVWLNKHNLDESESAFSQYDRIYYYKYYPIFDSNNNFSILDDQYRYKWTYNTDDKTWTISDTSITSIYTSNFFLQYHNNTYYGLNLNSWSYTDSYYNFKYNETDKEPVNQGYWINDTYKVVWVSNYIYNLINNNDSSIIYTFDFSSIRAYITTIIYKNNKILIITNNTTGNNVYWYRINLEQDYVGPDSSLTVTPLVALDNSVVRTKNVIMYYTGIENDDYLFTLDTTNDTLPKIRTLYAYKIVDNDIISAIDLQADLQALVGQSCYIFYDDRVKRLYVSTNDKIYLFTWKSGEFINENITINPLDYITPYDTSTGFCFALSDDMTTLFLHGITTSQRGTAYAFKRKTTSDDWYAENFAQCSSLSLTGFATGVTDLQKKYEVKTVLE